MSAAAKPPKCVGWLTRYCPNDASLEISWYYEGARSYPTVGVWCDDCATLVYTFIHEHQPGTHILMQRPVRDADMYYTGQL